MIFLASLPCPIPDPTTSSFTLPQEIVDFVSMSFSYFRDLWPEYEYTAALYKKANIIDAEKNPTFFVTMKYSNDLQEIFKTVFLIIILSSVFPQPQTSSYQSHTWLLYQSCKENNTYKNSSGPFLTLTVTLPAIKCLNSSTSVPNAMLFTHQPQLPCSPLLSSSLQL